MADHEGHLLGSGVLGGNDEVAFVLSTWVVHYEYEFAIAYAESGCQSRQSRQSQLEEEESMAENQVKQKRHTESSDCVRYAIELAVIDRSGRHVSSMVFISRSGKEDRPSGSEGSDYAPVRKSSQAQTTRSRQSEEV